MEQLESRHGATLAPIADRDGPHWQPMSAGAQPAALTALMMQAVWRGDVSWWCEVGEGV